MEFEDILETPKRIHGERKEWTEKILVEELGDKYVEYRKMWIKASKRELVTDFPLYIQIEHSAKCNLRCLYCIHGIETLRRDYSQDIRPLDLQVYKKILDEAKHHGCPSISFHNNDEPLLLSDLEDRIKLAKEAGFIDIILVTNATLLTPERSEKLIKSGITKISFSLDGWDVKSYEQVRKNGNFNNVLRNINYFLEQKKRENLRLPITRATCVLTKFTSKKMHMFREIWERKVDVVEFQNFQAIKGYTEKFAPLGSKIDEDLTCNGPWQQIVIRANGDVLPCCSFYGKDLVVGNINNSSIYDIWNSNSMKKLRKELLENSSLVPSVCKTCLKTFYKC